MAIPCSVHFQKVDETGVHALYVPPGSVWKPQETVSRSEHTVRKMSCRSINGDAVSCSHHRELSSSTRLGMLYPRNLRERQHSSAVVRSRADIRDATFVTDQSSRANANRVEQQNMAIDHSVICINVGSSVVWEMSGGARPIYRSVSMETRLSLHRQFPFHAKG